VEGGFDTELWHNRASLTFTYDNKTQHDAIISVPVAPSVGGGYSIKLNIGEIRNTSIEMTTSMTPLETPTVSWTVGGNLTHNENKVLRLDPTSAAFDASSYSGSSPVANTRVVVGYPLFGRWGRPILGYADANGDGIVENNEIRLGDTAVYLGRQDPIYTAALTSDLTLFHGRLGIHANVSRTGGYTQFNSASYSNGTFLSAANAIDATLGQQAAYVSAVAPADGEWTPIGLVQTVSLWRFESLSINYVVPENFAHHFRASRMSVALQGDNIGLWTNYRGKDPNVNAFPNGNATSDGGQIAQPRTWSLRVTLGN
jgi:hypothetical protein